MCKGDDDIRYPGTRDKVGSGPGTHLTDRLEVSVQCDVLNSTAIKFGASKLPKNNTVVVEWIRLSVSLAICNPRWRPSRSLLRINKGGVPVPTQFKCE